MNRRPRLAIAAIAIAIATSVTPFATPSASASYCNPAFQPVCDVVVLACNVLREVSQDLVACNLA